MTHDGRVHLTEKWMVEAALVKGTKIFTFCGLVIPWRGKLKGLPVCRTCMDRAADWNAAADAWQAMQPTWSVVTYTTTTSSNTSSVTWVTNGPGGTTS